MGKRNQSIARQNKTHSVRLRPAFSVGRIPDIAMSIPSRHSANKIIYA
jgi:hypothetical protein